MLNPNSDTTCGILYIDDEEKALKYFRMAFAEKFKIFTATSGSEGIAILEREQKDIGIVISDQRMPEMLGAEILGIVRERYPRIVRILTTAYSDLDSAIQAVNKGHIYQYVVKPWEISDLEMVLNRAADYFHVLSERDELLALKMTTLQRIVCGDRLKWLLLGSHSLGGSTKEDFQSALRALIRALPDSLNRPLSSDGKYRARDFEITSLLRDEYQNSSLCLGFLEKSLTENLSLEARLKALSTALAAKYKLSAEQISSQVTGKSAELKLMPGDLFSQEDFARNLFGLLMERKTDEIALLVIAAIATAATEQGTLSISVEARDTRVYKFSPSPDASDLSAAAIESLAEKFSSWDIFRM